MLGRVRFGGRSAENMAKRGEGLFFFSPTRSLGGSAFRRVARVVAVRRVGTVRVSGFLTDGKCRPVGEGKGG